MGDLQLLPLEEAEPTQVLDVIGQAFGAPRPRDWFDWKYRDGPWGPAWGLVAVEGGDVVGLRALLPWQLTRGTTAFTAARAIEASTTPAAQGRGIFSLLNRALMERSAEEGAVRLLYSTPNENSRPGYAKLGWTVTAPLVNRYRLVAPRRVRDAEHGDATVTGAPPPPSGGCGTVWTDRSWAWRFDPRSGRTYHGVRLHREGDNGLVYRAVTKRARTILSVQALWGRPEDRRDLLGAAAHRERTVVALLLSGPGSALPGTGWGVARPTSRIAFWAPGDPPVLPPAADLGAFRLWPADIEGAI